MQGIHVDKYSCVRCPIFDKIFSGLKKIKFLNRLDIQQITDM
jgi:hypothetical protein